MKKINPTQHGNTNTSNCAEAGNAPVRHVFKLGLDVDLNNVVTAIQCARGAIGLAQKFHRGQLIAWVQKQVGAGTRP